MKKGWEYKNFTKCLKKVPKQPHIKSKDYKTVGVFPIVSQEAELISGYCDNENFVYRHNKPIIIFGDHTKNIKYIDFDFITGADGTHILYPIDSIDSKYFYYVLKSIKLRNLGYARHFKLLKEKDIPVPPLSEQKEIANYLDSSFAKIDKLKENAAKNLEEAKALFQSALKDALEPKEGREEKTLKELSEIQSGYAFKSSDFKSSGKYQVIRMGNVRPGVIRYNESPVFINEELDEKAKEKALLQIGDMIITQTGSRNKRDYGFTVLIEKDNLLLNQRIARIRVKDKLLNKYLLYYSWTDYFRDQYFANEGGTVGQGNVGMDAIKDNIIPLPSLPEQQSIVSFLDSLNEKVNSLQQNYSRICDECDALKQAILRQVFE